MKIGQLVIIVKKPDRATNIEIGDIASECGFSDGEHQFHSKYLIDTGKQRENYWVEFLPRDCYQTAVDKEIDKLVDFKNIK